MNNNLILHNKPSGVHLSPFSIVINLSLQAFYDRFWAGYITVKNVLQKSANFLGPQMDL